MESSVPIFFKKTCIPSLISPLQLHVRHGCRRRRVHPRRPQLHSRLQERPRRPLPAGRLRPTRHRRRHRRLLQGRPHPSGTRHVGKNLPPGHCHRQRQTGQSPRPRILPRRRLLPRLRVRRRRARPRQPARRADRRDGRVRGVPARAGAPRPRALRGRLGCAPVGGRARRRPGARLARALAGRPRGPRARPRRRRERRRQHRAPRRDARRRGGARPRREGGRAPAHPPLLPGRRRRLRVGRDGHGHAPRAGAALAGGLPGDQRVGGPVDQPHGGGRAQPGPAGVSARAGVRWWQRPHEGPGKAVCSEVDGQRMAWRGGGLGGRWAGAWLPPRPADMLGGGSAGPRHCSISGPPMRVGLIGVASIRLVFVRRVSFLCKELHQKRMS